eukprot:4895662-Amphidinium_carterae.2
MMWTWEWIALMQRPSHVCFGKSSMSMLTVVTNHMGYRPSGDKFEVHKLQHRHLKRSEGVSKFEGVLCVCVGIVQELARLKSLVRL